MTREEAIVRIKEIGCYNDSVEKVQWSNGVIALHTADGKTFDFPSGGKLENYVDAADCKAVLLGHTFYTPDVLAKELDESTDFGNGKVEVLSSKKCMVCAAQAELDQMRAAGCGLCTFCREGAYQLSCIFADMKKPGAKKDALALAEEIGEAMLTGCNCPIGEETAQPVLSALANFRAEIEAHCGAGKCPAGECGGFSTIYVDPMKCEGAGDCMDVCPVDAIEGKKGFISMIDEFECTKCGKCVEACENEAIVMGAGKTPKLPTKLTKVGRFRK